MQRSEPSIEDNKENNSQKQFNLDLCLFLISLNIAFNKVNDKRFRDFVEKYTGNLVPHGSVLSRYYLPKVYNKTMEYIRQNVSDDRIWISIDQMTDSQQRHVSNVTVGSMEASKSSKSFLLSCEFLEKVNSHTVVQNVFNALIKLWPNGIKYDHLLLIITDAAPYVKSAAKTLMKMFEKAHHITCLCHALHNLSEHIQIKYPDVNRLITCGKLAFHKSDLRKDLLRSHDLLMTPQPVMTRWETWLKATEY